MTSNIPPDNVIALKASTIILAWIFLMISTPASGQDSVLPRTIKLGASVESLQETLTADCKHTETIHYEGEMAAPFKEQIQINCSGLQVWGALREVEFMFNDGPLGHVWILIQSEELQELRDLLGKAFGEVVYETELDYVFASGTVALRRHPPEILIATPGLVAELTGYQPDELY